MIAKYLKPVRQILFIRRDDVFLCLVFLLQHLDLIQLLVIVEALEQCFELIRSALTQAHDLFAHTVDCRVEELHLESMRLDAVGQAADLRVILPN